MGMGVGQRMLVKIKADFIFKRGTHLLEWQKYAKDGVVGGWQLFVLYACQAAAAGTKGTEARTCGGRVLTTCPSFTRMHPCELGSTAWCFLELLHCPGGELWFINGRAGPLWGCIYAMG